MTGFTRPIGSRGQPWRTG